MEFPLPPIDKPSSGLTVRMLGRLAVFRAGKPVELPASRKVRALLAYLALASHPVGRSRLCDLLGDVPNDPRGELRWCLSKLRAILNEPGLHRVMAAGDMISLHLESGVVDALQVDAATRSGLETLSFRQLRELCDLFTGDFLEGLDLNRSPQLDHWLTVQRRRYRTCQAAILEQLTRTLPEDDQEIRSYAEKWVALSPFDSRAQILLLKVLVESGELIEAERHFSAAMRLFEAEELDFGPIRQAWREIRDAQSKAARVLATRPILTTGADPPEIPEIGRAGVPRRGSLAVMPFLDQSKEGSSTRLADGLTHDIITRLAKLRNLFVIARGSVFALAARGIGPEEAARRLNVDYVTSGMVQHHPGGIAVAVELVEARTARIVWSEEFVLKPDDAFLVLEKIGDMIVSSIAAEIETAEKNRAILRPPNSLDSWELYHRGLWHMYRFTKADNDQAQNFFRRSIQQDPTFARAHAALSFTHWQNAFQQWADRDQETNFALEAAGRSLMADDHDPAAHWAMGRALWLRRRQGEAIAELEQAVDLSPNFALGHYSLSFVHSQSGDPAAAIASSDHSRRLSPFDPLLFGMLGARAMAHVRLGQFEEAAEWAIKAAARPNAHNIILAIAAHCLALAGRLDEARTFAGVLRQALPNYRVDNFLTTFKFPPDAEALFRQAARQVGLD